MSQELNQIGYFQFNNLAQSRVPFLLLNLGADLSGWFQGFAREHIERSTLSCAGIEALNEMKQKNVPPEQAVVVLSTDGEEAEEVGHQLEENGYINVYVIRGGLRGLEAERAN